MKKKRLYTKPIAMLLAVSCEGELAAGSGETPTGSDKYGFKVDNQYLKQLQDGKFTIVEGNPDDIDAKEGNFDVWDTKW